jgi:hypothetical protein
MVKIENNKLILSDNSYFDLEKSSLVRIVQDLGIRLKVGSLSKMDYSIAIDELEAYEIKKAALEMSVREQRRKFIPEDSINGKCIDTTPKNKN